MQNFTRALDSGRDGHQPLAKTVHLIHQFRLFLDIANVADHLCANIAKHFICGISCYKSVMCFIILLSLNGIVNWYTLSISTMVISILILYGLMETRRRKTHK